MQHVMHDDPFVVGSHRFSSRLLVGTGRYASLQQTKQVLEASGADVVTVALRRLQPSAATGDIGFTEAVDPARYTYLPNTAGCTTAEDAVRVLRLAHDIHGWRLVKLEVIGDAVTLYPDMLETLRAAELLTKEGFEVMAYATDDPCMCRRLEEAGCVAIMPLAAPIGSGMGIQNPLHLRMIIAQSRVPVLVDAGIGTPSHATFAMEQGCAGVLLNTALADAQDPIRMAHAMRMAVLAGREAFRAGPMAPRPYAVASSPS